MKNCLNPLLLESNIKGFKGFVNNIVANTKNKDLFKNLAKLKDIKSGINGAAVKQMTEPVGKNLVQTRFLPKSPAVAKRLVAKDQIVNDGINKLRAKEVLAAQGVMNQNHAFDTVKKYGVNNPLMTTRK